MIERHQDIKDCLRAKYSILLSKLGSAALNAKTFQALLALDVVALSTQMVVLLEDDAAYKRLLGCRGDSAQSVLNLLQADSRKYPECLLLEGITLPPHPVAAGSFGDVYQAKLAGNDIAVKAIRIYKKSDMDKGFAREAVIWQQLSHPNVLPFFGVFRLGQMQERLCLVCPWMDNGKMSDFLSDIAPESDCANILVSHARRACLADFGLAIPKESISVLLTVSSTRTAGGTLHWTAPELLPDPTDPESNSHETRRPGPACDVYAFAMVCYELIIAVGSGKRPERPVSHCAQSRGLTDLVWDIIVKCWQQQPEERISAAQAVHQLRALPDRPVDTRPLDNYNMPPPSQMMYKAQHPFSILEGMAEQTDANAAHPPGGHL
ncbi:hypothetical protein HWV62_16018 [Athelia sp. TMB]|nr:hypothetical protein HWV62_16018 [Athelia sp. TMB]